MYGLSRMVDVRLFVLIYYRIIWSGTSLSLGIYTLSRCRTEKQSSCKCRRATSWIHFTHGRRSWKWKLEAVLEVNGGSRIDVMWNADGNIDGLRSTAVWRPADDLQTQVADVDLATEILLHACLSFSGWWVRLLTRACQWIFLVNFLCFVFLRYIHL